MLFLLNAALLTGQVKDSTLVDNLLLEAGQIEDKEISFEKYETAYTLARELSYNHGLQKSLEVLAKMEQNRGNISRALRYWLEELNVLEKGTDWNRKMKVNLAIADLYASENLFAESLPYYQIASNFKRLSANEAAAIHEKLGNTFSQLDQPDSSYFYFSKLPAWKNQSKNNANARLNILHAIVKAYSKARQFSKALPFNLEILETMKAQDYAPKELSIIHNNLGYNYNFLKDYENAIFHFEQALELMPKKEAADLGVLQTNIGLAHFNKGDWDKSRRSLLKAKALLSQKGLEEKSQINHLIANVYLKSEDVYNASYYNETAIDNSKKHKQLELLSESYYTAAQIHTELFEYEIALDFYQKHLGLRDSIRLAEALRQQQLSQERLSYERAEKEIRLLLINQEVKNLTINQLELEKEKQQLALDNLQLDKETQQKELDLLKQDQEIKAAKLQNQELQTQQTLQQLALTKAEFLTAQKEQELEDLVQKEKLQKLELEQTANKLKQQEQESDILRKDQEISQLELDKQARFRQFAYGIGALFLLIIALILIGLAYSRRTNRKLEQQNTEIETQKNEITTERNKSESLLLNILPAATAQELKEKGSATPRRYENATILFADFVNFTRIAEKMQPEALVHELNHCFQVFDGIVEKHGLEKIKTIGDAYMCVGGLPEPNNSHPEDAAAAALEMMQFINQRYLQKKADNENYWKMRIGMHSGTVVAGVVGKNKFVYDIWGDAVNTASRMESNSEPGKINLSGTTRKLLNGTDAFHLTYRGKMEVKSKGEVEMFFLEV